MFSVLIGNKSDFLGYTREASVIGNNSGDRISNGTSGATQTMKEGANGVKRGRKRGKRVGLKCIKA